MLRSAILRGGGGADGELEGRRRSIRTLIILALAALLLFSGFLALGTWQVERRNWKLALIARVDARIAAPVTPAPGPDAWPRINAADDEYRRVRLSGYFFNDRETYVYAATDLGAGYWVMVPMRRADGAIFLVNRGFVPTDRRDPQTRSEGRIEGRATVTGLMRMSEPDGTWLRSNKPKEDRWYSRDVAAITAARGLSRAAPYFVDADATPNPGGLPVGGLTEVHFRNSHLVYAVTWYALALMVAAGTAFVARREWRACRPGRADVRSTSEWP